MYPYFFFITFLFSVYLSAHESSPIVVKLATEEQLIPVYVGKISAEGTPLSAEYLKELEEVLRFDLNYNGMTCALSNNQKGSFEYSVLPEVTQQGLSAEIIATHSHEKKSVKGFPLSGKLALDRKIVHQLADAIYATLFDAPGIAATRILYTIKRPTQPPTSEIWEADYDGENAHPIVQEKGYKITPIYMPPKPGHSASNIFYVSYKAAQPKIFMCPLKVNQGRRLTTLPGNQLMPAISRQRDQIAFVCDVTGNPDLFLQPFNPEIGPVGKPRQIFSAHKAAQGTPTFSPDGKKLAFVSNKDGSPKIYLMDIPAVGIPLKDIRATLISKCCKENSAPAWSPDGSKIAYCALTNGVRQIWVYDFTTKEERQITQGAGNKENPSWSPNSLALIYNCSDAASSHLYLITLHQPKATKIKAANGEKRFPCWEPRV